MLYILYRWHKIPFDESSEVTEYQTGSANEMQFNFMAFIFMIGSPIYGTFTNGNNEASKQTNKQHQQNNVCNFFIKHLYYLLDWGHS